MSSRVDMKIFDKWTPEAASSLQQTIDELFSLVTQRSSNQVLNNQSTPVILPKLRVKSNASGHYFEVTVDDSTTSAPKLTARDIGTNPFGELSD